MSVVKQFMVHNWHVIVVDILFFSFAFFSKLKRLDKVFAVQAKPVEKRFKRLQ